MTKPFSLGGPKEDPTDLLKGWERGTERQRAEDAPKDPMEAVARAKGNVDASMDRVMVLHHRTVQRSMEEYKLKLKKKILEAEIEKRRHQDRELLSLAVAEAINHRNRLKARALRSS
ncbi:MAG: hypothetical protein N2315_08430 [Thermanaerothrix sp.]|nr:hypothetical protein [Thermanaerothrix sp.]